MVQTSVTHMSHQELPQGNVKSNLPMNSSMSSSGMYGTVNNSRARANTYSPAIASQSQQHFTPQPNSKRASVAGSQQQYQMSNGTAAYNSHSSGYATSNQANFNQVLFKGFILC